MDVWALNLHRQVQPISSREAHSLRWPRPSRSTLNLLCHHHLLYGSWHSSRQEVSNLPFVGMGGGARNFFFSLQESAWWEVCVWACLLTVLSPKLSFILSNGYISCPLPILQPDPLTFLSLGHFSSFFPFQHSPAWPAAHPPLHSSPCLPSPWDTCDLGAEFLPPLPFQHGPAWLVIPFPS